MVFGKAEPGPEGRIGRRWSMVESAAHFLKGRRYVERLRQAFRDAGVPSATHCQRKGVTLNTCTEVRDLVVNSHSVPDGLSAGCPILKRSDFGDHTTLGLRGRETWCPSRWRSGALRPQSRPTYGVKPDIVPFRGL
jgi:hypothetical protein